MKYYLLALDAGEGAPFEVHPSYHSDKNNRSMFSKRCDTAVDVSSYNSCKGKFSERDTCFINDIREAVGCRPFYRKVRVFGADDNYLDAGNLRRGIEHGYIRYLSGRNDSPDCMFQLTEKAIRALFPVA